MTWFTLTRFRATLLGCGLAVVGCLLAPAWSPVAPQQSLFALPETLDTWELLGEGNLQESELRILQASHHWRRVYQCRETEQVAVVTLVVGAGGPLASHDPEICYARNEFSSHSEAKVWTVPGQRDQFRFQTLEPRQVGQPALTIAYAWHDGEHWRAPLVPRLQLAGHASLQRLQVTVWHPSGMTRDVQAAIRQFVELSSWRH